MCIGWSPTRSPTLRRRVLLQFASPGTGSPRSLQQLVLHRRCSISARRMWLLVGPHRI
uniref:Uncharacterized protein n=1 Tax=Arundo donax TaxID=35708 RepID=A0A0A8YDE8_ARUDO